jgi:hypothetical protein
LGGMVSGMKEKERLSAMASGERARMECIKTACVFANAAVRDGAGRGAA